MPLLRRSEVLVLGAGALGAGLAGLVGALGWLHGGVRFVGLRQAGTGGSWTRFASRETFAGFTRRLIAIPQSGDRSAPSLLDRNARNLAGRWVARRAWRSAKVRFARLQQRRDRSWTRSAPRRANIDQDLSRRPEIWGQNARGTTQTLEGWTCEWVSRGQKGRGCGAVGWQGAQDAKRSKSCGWASCGGRSGSRGSLRRGCVASGLVRSGFCRCPRGLRSEGGGPWSGRWSPRCRSVGRH